MRQAAYLSTSRHGIFYFRQPLPSHLHPDRVRSDVKVSLGTRDPRKAAALSRLLSGYGQSLCIAATLRNMRYEEIRTEVQSHFKDLLEKFREGVAARGQARSMDLSALTNARSLSEDDPEVWATIAHKNGKEGLLRAFSEARGIKDDLTPEQRGLLLGELHKGYRAYVSAALDHNSSFDSFNLISGAVGLRPEAQPNVSENTAGDTTPCSQVVKEYFQEITHADALAAKTRSEKKDALKLLGEIMDDKPLSEMTKADARKVKDALLKLPKNRSKSAQTRDMPLREMLKITDVEKIAARTVNAYISNMQSFFKWAVDNGHADQNIFTGMRVAVSKKTKDQVREAFSTEQLNTLFTQLTLNPENLVRKDEHKWGTLIGMFTGMRLNEVAQLEVSDIKKLDGVWCIEVTEGGDNNKRLKNASSTRRVPVHNRLIENGFLDFVERQTNNPMNRLFPSLSYSAQNGHGRNIGRWFNEKLLPALGIKSPGLVYHSLRHTMVTRLNQSDAPETKVKAILGHAQAGVTFSDYFKEGFKPAQLKEVIDRFDF